MKDGPLVTDNHVIEGCAAADLWALSPMGEKILFAKSVSDSKRDLALLRPTKPLEGGLELSSNQSTRLATKVTTWGFPLIYNGRVSSSAWARRWVQR